MKRCALVFAVSLALTACQPTTIDTSSNPAQTPATPAAVTAAQAAPFQVKTFSPGKNAIFQVASNLVVGANEVLLVDAQFAANDAQRLVEEIRASG